jgi:hypothetical protein
MCAGNRLLVVDENFGHVVECGCGTLQVGVGPVSLALDAASLRKLHEMIGVALMRLTCAADDLQTTDEVAMHSSHFELRKVVKFRH